jgi:NitT/TauT family transport system permease protein
MGIFKNIRVLISLLLWGGIALFIQFFPGAGEESESALFYLTAIIWGLLLILFAVLQKKNPQLLLSIADLSIIFGLIFLVWEVMTGKWELLDPFVFPAPAQVLASLLQDQGEIGSHVFASTKLLLTGYGLALVSGIALGLYAGWSPRLYNLVKPFANVASPIPPIVYIPYAITVLPSFFMSSVFVVFIGAFWPVLINTLNGVVHIEQRLIESARTLQLSPFTMLRKILLPGALPGIFTGASIGLVFSFILLTAAELIGAEAGLGYYIKYHTDFGDFSRVIVGIILIGIYVTLLMGILQRVEKYFLRWKQR